MTKAELFHDLTDNQKNEFENDMQTAIGNLISSRKIYADKLSKVNIHLHLESKIFLHVRLSINSSGKIFGKDITRFSEVDQFLDSINDVRQRSN